MENIIKVDVIQDYMEKEHLSGSALAKKCGITKKDLEHILTQDQFALNHLLKLSRVMNVSICDLTYDPEEKRQSS